MRHAIGQSSDHKFTISTFLFVLAFFLQIYIDGHCIAHQIDPGNLKIAKYAVFVLGIIWGGFQIRNKKRCCFIKETRMILFALLAFLIISLVLIFVRNSDLSFCLELIFRFAISILYAFVLLNLFNYNEIYRLMTYLLFISILGWYFEKGGEIFTIANIRKISFIKSSSVFESNYFAASSINCCAFFMYYRDHKWITAVSFLFVLLTFKRPSIVFAILFLLLPFFLNANKQIKKKWILIWQISIIASTVIYYNLLLPQNEWIIQRITGQDTAQFTQGRSTLLRLLLSSGYQSAGLGSTQYVTFLGRGIEMDLISFLLEMTIVGLAIFVFCYTYVARQNGYCILVMTFHMISCMTGSGLYNAFGWVSAFMLFGCINYKKQVAPCRRICFAHIRKEYRYE